MKTKKYVKREAALKLNLGKSADTTLHFFPEDPEGSDFRHPGSIALRSSESTRIFDCHGPTIQTTRYSLSVVKYLLPGRLADMSFFPVGNVLGNGGNANNVAFFVLNW